MKLLNEEVMVSEKDESFSNLLDIVKKESNAEHGAFYDMLCDLRASFGNGFLDENGVYRFENYKENYNLIKMSYGYVYRGIMAGLYIQCLTDKSTYDIAKNVFHTLQNTTNQNQEFQIDAAQLADDFMISYDPSINETITGFIVYLAENNMRAYSVENVAPLSGYLETINMVKRFSTNEINANG